MTEEELLKKIAELESENKRLKESQGIKMSIWREDAFNSIKNLLERDTQSYQSLANKMGISDRTLRTFVLWDSEDTSDKTLGIMWEYFTEEFKSSYKDLALYRAYTNASNLEEREQIYERLNSLFDDFLREFDKIYDKKIYSIKEKWIVATWEVVSWWFMVHKWSEWVRDYVKSANAELFNRKRESLIAEWIIRREWDKIVFLEDYTFNTPSWAARMIVWSFANWRIRRRSEWVTLRDAEPELYEQEKLINRPITPITIRQLRNNIIRVTNSERMEERIQNTPVSMAYIYPLNGRRKLNCTFKKPNWVFIDWLYYEEINDWTKVMPLIWKILYEKNPIFFKRMVDWREIVKDKWDLIIADYKVSSNRNSIEWTDYYVEQCFSANDVRKYTWRLIKYWNDNSWSKIDVKVRIKKTRF